MKIEEVLAKLQVEFDDIEKKYNKLSSLIGLDSFRAQVGNVQYKLLLDQMCAMSLYLKILDERICDLMAQSLHNKNTEEKKTALKNEPNNKDINANKNTIHIKNDVPKDMQDYINVLRSIFGEHITYEVIIKD